MIEPMLDRLKPGANSFNAEDFRALVGYFLGDDIRRRDQAFLDDRFRILNVEIVCERELTFRNGITVSEFARQHGIGQRTLWYRVSRAGFKFLRFGSKKLYYPEDLRSVLENANPNV
jgi:hypothetical protein